MHIDFAKFFDKVHSLNVLKVMNEAIQDTANRICTLDRNESILVPEHHEPLEKLAMSGLGPSIALYLTLWHNRGYPKLSSSQALFRVPPCLLNRLAGFERDSHLPLERIFKKKHIPLASKLVDFDNPGKYLKDAMQEPTLDDMELPLTETTFWKQCEYIERARKELRPHDDCFRIPAREILRHIWLEGWQKNEDLPPAVSEGRRLDYWTFEGLISIYCPDPGRAIKVDLSSDIDRDCFEFLIRKYRLRRGTPESVEPFVEAFRETKLHVFDKDEILPNGRLGYELRANVSTYVTKPLDISWPNFYGQKMFELYPRYELLYSSILLWPPLHKVEGVPVILDRLKSVKDTPLKKHLEPHDDQYRPERYSFLRTEKKPKESEGLEWESERMLSCTTKDRRRQIQALDE